MRKTKVIELCYIAKCLMAMVRDGRSEMNGTKGALGEGKERERARKRGVCEREGDIEQEREGEGGQQKSGERESVGNR